MPGSRGKSLEGSRKEGLCCIKKFKAGKKNHLMGKSLLGVPGEGINFANSRFNFLKGRDFRKGPSTP